jgi:hypothetical protein
MADFRRPFVGGIRRSDDLDAGDPLEPGAVDLRMHGAEAPAGADGRAHHERDAGLFVRDVPELRCLIHEAVHRQRHEVAEHDLDDGPQAGDRGTERRAGHRELRDGRVEDALHAVLLVQPRGRHEHAAGERDILAEEDDRRVSLDLLVERVADRLAELERLAHSLNSVPPS